MPNYTQDNRPLSLTTPLGKDKLLLTGCSVNEAVSRLFSMQVETIALNGTDVPFDKLLCQKATVEIELPNKKKRYFNGLVSRVIEGGRDMTFTNYTLEIVPKLWLLTRKSHSRIFQRMNVPDILKKVLQGIDIEDRIQGTFEKREYCVQYRETDFNFASRLMEEEGIFYYFKHSNGDHKMVLGNDTSAHADLSDLSGQSKVIFEELVGGVSPEDRIYSWTKTQEIRPEKVTLWDHTYELPHQHLEGNKDILQTVQVGTVSHKLKVAGSENLEMYDWPGEYAQRFDGVNSGGGDQSSETQKVFKDNSRTAGLRMEEHAADAIVIHGASHCREFTSGYKFTMDRHFNANGPYVLNTVQHFAQQDNYRGSGGQPLSYHNSFTCTPFALPYRPARLTPKPTVTGPQTAVVVGPSGQEICTDKYGRVKVQFHWDREGKNDSNSSCWVRVATSWAGKSWGAINIPRIGQEVVVAFEEGDPDCPLILGSVYNADQMPPYKLPDEKTKSTVKSRSTMSGGTANWNEIRFEDKKGTEQIFVNAEKDMDLRVENDSREFIKSNRHLIVQGNQAEKVSGNKDGHVVGNLTESADGNLSLTVGGQRQEKIGTIDTIEAGQEVHIKAGMKVIIEAGVQISLVVGSNFVDISPAGVTIMGTMVLINSGGAPGTGTPSSPATPKDPDVADDGTKTGKLN